MAKMRAEKGSLRTIKKATRTLAGGYLGLG